MQRKFQHDIDPRDRLSKARRSELLAYAQANGIEDVDDDVPARVLRKLLRARNLTNPTIPPRFLGMPDKPAEATPPVDEMVGTGEVLDAEDSFMAQWEEERRRNAKPESPPSEATKTIDDMSFMEMRQECKRRGIPWTLKDKKVELKAKLDGQDPA